MRKRGIIGTLLLLVYLAGVGLFTGPSLAQIFLGRLPQPRLELVPFADMISVVKSPEAPGLGPFVNIAGNIALLFPLGLFLPLFWRWFERAGRTIWWCFGTSLSIELIQLAAGGVTSADDLLLNTLGGALGIAQHLVRKFGADAGGKQHGFIVCAKRQGSAEAAQNFAARRTAAVRG